MTWQTGTSTDYRDLLDQLIEIATSRHCSAAAINAVGSGYVVGDVLTIDNTGATYSHQVTLEVMAVGGSGDITSWRISNGGAYTVDPTTTTNNTTSGGTGSGATVDLTFADTGWSTQRRTQEAVSAAVATAGSGYSVSDQLTLDITGGVQGDGGVDAVFNVDSVDGGGGVTGVSLVTAGNYEEAPTNDNTPTGGAGSGCELTVTYQDAATQDDQVCILEGTAAGAIAPIVGIKLWQGLNHLGTQTTYNWALFGMTSYTSSLEFQDQVNLSPGLQGDGSMTTDNAAAITVLKDSDAFNMEFWISVTGRRIMGCAKAESASTTIYAHFHLGLLNPLGTTSEFEYPLYIAGSTNRITAWYQDTLGNISGLTELSGFAGGGTSGPGYLWYPEGTEWLTCINAVVSSDTDNTPTPGSSTDNQGVYPCFQGTDNPDAADQIVGDTPGWDWRNIIWVTVSPLEVFATTGSGDALIPCIVMRRDQSASPDVFSLIGEIDGLFWTSTADGQSAEDDILIDTTRYRLFANGNRVQTFSHCAFRED